MLAHAFANFEANVVPICTVVSKGDEAWDRVTVPMVSRGGGGKGIAAVFWKNGVVYILEFLISEDKRKEGCLLM